MAGIYISGGTVTSSGDLTTDWMVEDPSAGGTFTAPDGTLTYVGKYGGAGSALNHCHYARGTFNHNNGTITVNPTKDGGTRNISSTAGGVRDLYSLTLLSGSISASYANDVRYSTECTLDGDLTIDGTDSAANTPIFQPGSQTFDLIVVGNVSVKTGTFGGNFNYGTMTLGSMNIQSGGIFDAPGDNIHGTGGITTINNQDGSTYKLLNNGTFIHNSGTLVLDASTNGGIYDNTGWLYNLTVKNDTTNAAAVQNYTMVNVGNDLIVSGAGSEAASWDVALYNAGDGADSFNVSGTATVINGAKLSRSNITTADYGALIIGAKGWFDAGATTTFYYTSDGFSLNNEDTFTHNDGTVKIDFENGGAPGSARTGYNSDSKVRCASGDLYNLEVEMNRDGDATKMYPPAGSENMIANDLTITKGTFFKYNDNYTLIVSGTVTTAASSTFGLASATANDTIGEISNTGTYVATRGETIIDNDMNGGVYQFQNEGTFTHNSGTVVATGASGKVYINSIGTPTTPTTFYNLTSKTSTDYTSIQSDIIVENILDNQTYFMMNGGYRDFDLTLGTSGQQGIINNSNTFAMNYSYYKDLKIKGASEVYPAILSGTKYQWGSTHADTGSQMLIENVHFKDDIETGEVEGGCGFTLTGPCEFAAFTVKAGDLLNCSGQRVTFGGALNITGSMVTSGSLMILDKNVNYDGEGWLGNETTNIMFTGTGATHDFAGQPYQHIVFNGTGEDKLNWATNFPDTPIIVAGGTFKPDHNVTAGNISIANGGTWNNDVDVLTLSSGKNFSNRGGLFTSSSAVTIDSATNSYAQTGDGVNPLTASVTWECWFNSTGTAGEMLMANDDSPTRRGGYLRTNGTVITWYLNGVTNTVTTNSNIVATGSNHEDGKWHNITAVYDSGNYLYLYLDGKLIGKDAATGTPSSDSGVRFYLGYANSNYFDGTFGRVSVWSSALTEAQIRKMMFEDFATATTTNCVSWYQFDEGEGTTLATKVGGGTLYMGGGAAWATAGTWTAGNKLGSETEVLNGNIYIGAGTEATIFGSSYFPIANRKLVEGSKFVSKAHMGTPYYYIATSGASDYLNYQKLTGAPIGTHSDVIVTADSYFNFDSSARNEQCNILLNEGVVRIVTNSDFYTQDFDNKGTWLKNGTYDGIIHDDGSTPHEYEPIDIMDDQDSFFDREDLID